MKVLHVYPAMHGCPFSLYLGGHSIFRISHTDRESDLTGFSRAIKTPGNEVAHTQHAAQDGRVHPQNAAGPPGQGDASGKAGISSMRGCQRAMSSSMASFNRCFISHAAECRRCPLTSAARGRQAEPDHAAVMTIARCPKAACRSASAASIRPSIKDRTTCSDTENTTSVKVSTAQ